MLAEVPPHWGDSMSLSTACRIAGWSCGGAAVVMLVATIRSVSGVPDADVPPVGWMMIGFAALSGALLTTSDVLHDLRYEAMIRQHKEEE